MERLSEKDRDWRRKKRYAERWRENGDQHEGHSRFMLLALLAAGRPLTVHEFRHQFLRMGYHFSLPLAVMQRDQEYLRDDDILESLGGLRAEGLLTRGDDATYDLTDAGRRIAEDMETRMGRAAAMLGRFVSDSRLASMVSIVLNAVLAALKLAAGFLFGSVALLADGFDSSMDVVSAIVVFLGIRHRKELAASGFIVVAMGATAVFIGYESIGKLLSGEPVDASIIAFATAVVSGVVCYLMSVYQHFVGKRSASLSLLSQSIDSRNHVIQAGAVLVGLVFAVFHVYAVDAIVGMVVAVLILRSAVELATEVVKATRGSELDGARFRREYERVWSGWHRRHFEAWLLVLLKEPHSKEEILFHYQDMYSPEGLPVVQHFSPARTFDLPSHLDEMLVALHERGLVGVDGALYSTTREGSVVLRKSARKWRFVSS
ncbi:MAG: cation diffusion facilitator family transporter [Dehalococcoidia bacterium]|nr:cation diffusion facilitator family transporter [Dehalococcoidia bacterium]